MDNNRYGQRSNTWWIKIQLKSKTKAPYDMLSCNDVEENIKI